MPASLAGQAIELDQRELDLLMAGIAALLARSGAERRRDMIDVALHDIEQPPPTGRLEIGDCAFEQMAGVVEFVVVAQVGPALVGFAADCTSS